MPLHALFSRHLLHGPVPPHLHPDQPALAGGDLAQSYSPTASERMYLLLGLDVGPGVIADTGKHGNKAGSSMDSC